MTRAPLMLLALTTSSAWAYTPPAYDADQTIYIVPEGTEVATRATRAAVDAVEHPTVVVFANNVVDNERGDAWSSDTEDAIEDTWAAWSRSDAFAADVTSVVLVGMDDREVRILTGSTWDVDLGLSGTALTQLTERHFVPQARAGNIDEAAARTVTALDAEISRLVAWEASAPERAARAEAERRAYEQRMAQLEQRQREADTRLALERQQRNAELRRAAGYTGAGFVALSGIGAAGLWVGSRRRRRNQAAAQFQESWTALRDRLGRAEELVADLRMETEVRKGVLALRMKGPQTQLLLDAVTAAIDHIHVRLQAMRHHLTTLRDRAQKVGWSDTATFETLLAQLESGFTYTPKDAGTLFNAPKPVVVDFPTFEAELQVRFDEARLGWTRLQDAVEASMRTAADDFPLDGLQEIMTLVTDLELPLGWAQDHPLSADAEAAWEELDALRTSDPVHYLDILDAMQAEEDDRIELLRDIDAMREDLTAARARLVAIRLTDGTELTADQDPETMRQVADRERERFEQLVSDLADDDEIVHAGSAALEAYQEALRRADIAVSAAQTAPTRYSAVERELNALRSEQEKERQELSRLSEVHANLAAAHRELEEATQDATEAATAFHQARAAIDRGAWVTAIEHLDDAVKEQQEALMDLRELRTVTQELKQKRTEVTTIWSSLDATRARLSARLNRIDVPVDKALAQGDQMRDTLRAEWNTAADWSARSTKVSDIVRAWRTAVFAREQDAQRARAELERKERAARQAWKPATHSTSWRSPAGRSTPSWGSTSSMGSSTRRSSRPSRSRSSGSSYSTSRSRSGGSSFKSSSSGRSGGSKW